MKRWENRQKVEKDSSVKYYVFTIAHNSSISLLRKKATSTQFIEYLKLNQNLYQESVNAEFEYNELQDRLNEIIAHLPERQKEVYLLHKVQGLKYQEIAKKLSISENTIENHMSKALKTIREKLGKYSIVPLLFFFLFV